VPDDSSGADPVGRLVQQGQEHHRTGDVAEAVECWREALRLDPGHVEARQLVDSVEGELAALFGADEPADEPLGDGMLAELEAELEQLTAFQGEFRPEAPPPPAPRGSTPNPGSAEAVQAGERIDAVLAGLLTDLDETGEVAPIPLPEGVADLAPGEVILAGLDAPDPDPDASARRSVSLETQPWSPPPSGKTRTEPPLTGGEPVGSETLPRTPEPLMVPALVPDEPGEELLDMAPPGEAWEPDPPAAAREETISVDDGVELVPTATLDPDAAGVVEASVVLQAGVVTPKPIDLLSGQPDMERRGDTLSILDERSEEGGTSLGPAVAAFQGGDAVGALDEVERLLAEQPDHDGAREFRERIAADAERSIEERLGRLDVVPALLVRPEELVGMPLDHRAGFVVSQVDGSLSLEDICDLSGMSRLETLRTLVQLLDAGVIAC